MLFKVVCCEIKIHLNIGINAWSEVYNTVIGKCYSSPKKVQEQGC